MSATWRPLMAALILVTTLMTTAQAAPQQPLRALAQAHGFRYDWSPPQGTVILTRPGAVVVIRPGNMRYDVNDTLRYFVGAPVFRKNEIFVDSTFGNELAALEERYPSPPATGAARSASMFGTGTFKITAAFIPGALAIRIFGSGPPNVAVYVSLNGLISGDLPTVNMAHVQAITSADGTYDVVVPVSITMFPHSTFVASVSSPGMTTASASVAQQLPNPTLHTGNEGLPKDH